MRMRARFQIVVMSAALVGAFALGAVTRPAAIAETDTPPPYPQLETLARVLSYIDNNYVDPVDEASVLYAAIKAMVRSLDPHSSFMTPEEFAAMREDTRGEYVGVGMELGIRDDRITVIAPFQGGPAFEAGIEPGDALIDVDGTSVSGLTIEAVVQTLRGERGAPVALTVLRADEEGDHFLNFTLIRDVIRVPAVRQEMLAPGYGYVSVTSFQAGVSSDMVSAIDDLEVENGGELAGLILDLRNDPGGLLSEAISMSDLLLDEGLVVTTEGRDPEEHETYRSRDGATRYRGPVVVLINSGTASASEIVAGALQDRGRATLIGATTFGKGTVQSIIDFEDGSGLKLTTARYYTPDHRSIHGQGVSPDIPISSGNLSEEELDPRFPGVIDRQILTALDVLAQGGQESL